MAEGVDGYIHFDEYTDVIAALELVAVLSPQVKENELWWKWIVMGLQNAMQASMVLALAGTAGLGALDSKSYDENWKWLNNRAEPRADRPKIRMASYSLLLERVQKQEGIEGPPLVLNQEQHRNLERLNELRRQFAHYNPTGWGIELAYLLNIVPDTLNAIEHLLTTQQRVRAHFEEEQCARITGALVAIRHELCANRPPAVRA